MGIWNSTIQNLDFLKIKFLIVQFSKGQAITIGIAIYSNHLKTGLVWYSNGRFVSGCQMVQYLNGGLKTMLKKPVYGPKCQVWILNCELQPMLSNIIWSVPFEYQIFKSSVLRWIWYSGVWYSDGYCIQILTVVIQ